MSPTEAPNEWKVWAERRAIAVRLLGQGVTTTQIARQLGVSALWVQALRRRLADAEGGRPDPAA